MYGHISTPFYVRYGKMSSNFHNYFHLSWIDTLVITLTPTGVISDVIVTSTDE